jgi:adiponectin receptor
MAISNIVGAVVYVSRVLHLPLPLNVNYANFIKAPERWCRYRFDNFVTSHQVMHFAVMVAAAIHLCGLLEAFMAVRSDAHVCVER